MWKLFVSMPLNSYKWHLTWLWCEKLLKKCPGKKRGESWVGWRENFFKFFQQNFFFNGSTIEAFLEKVSKIFLKIKDVNPPPLPLWNLCTWSNIPSPLLNWTCKCSNQIKPMNYKPTQKQFFFLFQLWQTLLFLLRSKGKKHQRIFRISKCKHLNLGLIIVAVLSTKHV